MTSRELVISGGGSLVIATDELDAIIDRCGPIARRLDAVADELATVAALADRGAAPLTATPSTALASSARTCQRSADRLHGLRTGLVRARDEYSQLEWRLRARMAGWSADVAFGAGNAVGFGLAMLGPAGVLGLAAALFAAGPELQLIGAAAGKRLREHPELLADPAFLAFVRLAVDAADDALRGVARLPPGLGDSEATGFGPFQPQTPIARQDLEGRQWLAALALAAVTLTARGDLTRVRLSASPAGSASAPRTLAALARRIPGQESGAAGMSAGPGDGGAEDEPQVRIERYLDESDSPRFVVYLGGTADFGLPAGDEPFDMTSNIAGVADRNSAALETARAAMREAGIDSGAPVLFVGYSQGGLLAERLADGGDYTVAGAVTFGSPGTGIIDPRIPAVAIAHTDDLVPALGGMRSHDAAESHVIVERAALAGMPFPEGQTMPAHDMAAYRRTAELADASSEDRLVAARGEVLGFLEGSRFGQATEFRGVRIEL
ncbi:hypothetical protein [Naasia lichenicola]|uniref:Alpha/beta hydrolase n=1 Tax=Naasia lichenicola TaxID=2565933 RepID=A0A4S4FK05_9MICO|nr:hypothetical protein [Naasia lichenicola]THG29486.1 hypothetical protein E6C64_12370 [Naasia lichenicola]